MRIMAGSQPVFWDVSIRPWGRRALGTGHREDWPSLESVNLFPCPCVSLPPSNGEKSLDSFVLPTLTQLILLALPTSKGLPVPCDSSQAGLANCTWLPFMLLAPGSLFPFVLVHGKCPHHRNQKGAESSSSFEASFSGRSRTLKKGPLTLRPEFAEG